ncbi:MAG: EamA family transporter [Euryarchaeota archaeon]|nr:EamA family transporter [Euryarchaeota archaeon]|tara:strand:- start:24 stop:914 length:891 start_codon:yes stop_codon:yes gene_type:complete
MIIALAGAGAISFAPILYKLSETNPATGAFFRMAYAVPLLLLIVFLSKKEETRDIRSRRLTFLAGLIIAFDFLAYHSAIDYVGTGIATLVGNSQVIIVTLVSWKLLGERPNRSILISLPVVVFGLALISGIWDGKPYGDDPTRGVIAAVFAAFFYSSFLIVYRHSNKTMGPAANAQLDATLGATIGLLFLGLIPLESVGVQQINFEITWPSHLWLLLLAFSCQVAGWIAITYALPRLPGAHTSFAVLIQPVLTIIWGIFLLEETPSTQQGAGMVLIFIAIIAVTIFGDAKAKPESV